MTGDSQPEDCTDFVDLVLKESNQGCRLEYPPCSLRSFPDRRPGRDLPADSFSPVPKCLQPWENWRFRGRSSSIAHPVRSSVPLPLILRRSTVLRKSPGGMAESGNECGGGCFCRSCARPKDADPGWVNPGEIAPIDIVSVEPLCQAAVFSRMIKLPYQAALPSRPIRLPLASRFGPALWPSFPFHPFPHPMP